ncbi:MAG: flagellar motor protein MotB [Rickettsiales bacterium]
MAEVEQPIIKKVYKLEGGHHGGAWKVAYADFVTAMMAFFLLLWLLSTTSEAQKEAIADYFTPTIGLKDEMGIGFEGGATPNEEGVKKSDLMPPGVVVGQVQPGPTPETPKDTLIESDQDAKLFEKAEQAVKQAMESDPNLRDYKDNVIVEQSPEGLKIQIVDSDKDSMFEPGTSKLTEFGRNVLSSMAKIIAMMPNYISLTGHTDASAFSNGNSYGNWELSADRANSSRRFLLTTGMPSQRVAKIVGLADKELLFPQTPRSPKNRRITIILLRGAYMNVSPTEQPAPRELLTNPQKDDLDTFDKKLNKTLPNQIPVYNHQPAKPAVNTNPVGALGPESSPSVTPPANPSGGAVKGPTGKFDQPKATAPAVKP